MFAFLAMIDINSQLWCDKYHPKRYIDLLTDEQTNRNLLTWMNNWKKDDTEVKPGSRFASNRFAAKKPQQSYNTLNFKNQDPTSGQYLIIGGDPGTGKSSLARVIAEHCKYRPEILNISEEVSINSILTKLFFATQNNSLKNYKKDEDKLQTCLIVDGISFDDRLSLKVLKVLELYAATGKLKMPKLGENDEPVQEGMIVNTASKGSFTLDKSTTKKQKKQKIKTPIIII